MNEQSHTGTIVLLTRLARVVYRSSTESLLGIRLKELAVLAYLRDHPHVSQAGLADALCTDANTCVLILNELENAGRVHRRRDPADRRRHLVEITEDGVLALEQAEAAQATIEDDVLASLSVEERETLRELLHRALADMPERSAPAELATQA